MAQSFVFVPDEKWVWLSGVISRVSDLAQSEIEVRIQDDAIVDGDSCVRTIRQQDLQEAGLDSLPLQNPDMPIEGAEDMCNLGFLHEPSILDNLRRYGSCYA
jgi:myosin heavy subunit